MMNIISPYSINGVLIGASLHEVIGGNNTQNLFFEVDKDEITSISFRNEISFMLNGENISMVNINYFLEKENPYIDDIMYIFPDLNIAIYDLNVEKMEYELTLYGKSVKKLFEKNLSSLPRFNSTRSILNDNLTASTLFFLPYISVGLFKFGTNPDNIVNLLGSPMSTGLGVKSKLIFNYDFLEMRFDNEMLTQVKFDLCTALSLKRNITVGYSDFFINLYPDLMKVISNNESIVNGGYHVLPKLGFSAIFQVKESKVDELIFFDQLLLKSWINKLRPITSW